MFSPETASLPILFFCNKNCVFRQAYFNLNLQTTTFIVQRQYSSIYSQVENFKDMVLRVPTQQINQSLCINTISATHFSTLYNTQKCTHQFISSFSPLFYYFLVSHTENTGQVLSDVWRCIYYTLSASLHGLF